jgi:ubiquinone/menaquinone biosynthesis C-methylase UbiE
MSDLKLEYDKWHKDVAVNESSNTITLCEWHHDAVEAFSDIQGKDVLEIGCGRGDFSLYLKKFNAVIHGTDFSDSAISIAKAKAALTQVNISFTVADAQNLPFPDSSFDVLYSCECLEHIPDPQKALDEMFRVLRTNGMAVITTENYSNGMLALWIKSWLTKKPFNSGDEVQPIEHFFLFWKVLKMMRGSGFRVKEFKGWHYVFLILPRGKNWIINRIHNKTAKWLFKPFARHMTFLLEKP